jgi:hypothetical protein
VTSPTFFNNVQKFDAPRVLFVLKYQDFYIGKEMLSTYFMEVVGLDCEGLHHEGFVFCFFVWRKVMEEASLLELFTCGKPDIWGPLSNKRYADKLLQKGRDKVREEHTSISFERRVLFLCNWLDEATSYFKNLDGWVKKQHQHQQQQPKHYWFWWLRWRVYFHHVKISKVFHHSVHYYKELASRARCLLLLRAISIY